MSTRVVSRSGEAVADFLNQGHASVATTRFKLTAGFVAVLVAMNLQFGPVKAGSGLANTLIYNAANILLFVMTMVLIVNSIGRHDDVGFRAKLLAHDAIYLVWLGALATSIVWSVSPLETFRSIVPLAAVWLATLFLHQVPVADAVRLVVFAAVGVAFLSLVAVPVMGGEFAYQPVSSTGAPELRGIFDHQLRLGAFMGLAIGLVVLAALNGDTRWIRSRSATLSVLGLIVLVLVLVLSRARLYVGDAALALLLTVLLSRRGAHKVLSLLAVAALAFFAALNFDQILSKLENSGFDTTLTGRTDIWRRALNGVTDQDVWFGNGFDTFKLPFFDYLYPVHYRASHAHSSYIQALFETGLIGLFALIILICAQLWVAWRYSQRCNRFSYSLFLVLYCALGSATGLVYTDSRLSPIFGLMLMFLAIESRSPSPMVTANVMTKKKNDSQQAKCHRDAEVDV